MLKLQRKGLVLLALWVGIASIVMACDQGGTNTPAGCGSADVMKEVIVSLPTDQETSGVVDSYEIEIIDAVSEETLQQIEALPGESKAASIVDIGVPITVKATAFDAAGNSVAEGESTSDLSMEHNGLFCDFSVTMDMTSYFSPVNATIDVTMDCHIADVIHKMVDFVKDAFNKTVEVYQYVVHDVVEDITNIIEIIR